MTFEEYWRDAREGCEEKDEPLLKAWAEDAWKHAMRQSEADQQNAENVKMKALCKALDIVKVCLGDGFEAERRLERMVAECAMRSSAPLESK